MKKFQLKWTAITMLVFDYNIQDYCLPFILATLLFTDACHVSLQFVWQCWGQMNVQPPSLKAYVLDSTVGMWGFVRLVVKELLIESYTVEPSSQRQTCATMGIRKLRYINGINKRCNHVAKSQLIETWIILVKLSHICITHFVYLIHF